MRENNVDLVLNLLNDTEDANHNLIQYLCRTNQNYHIFKDMAKDYIFNTNHNDSAKSSSYGLYLNQYQSKRRGNYYALSSHENDDTVETLLDEQQFLNVVKDAKFNQLSIIIALIKRVLTIPNKHVQSLF